MNKAITLYDKYDNETTLYWESENEDFDLEFSKMISNFINKYNGMIKIFNRDEK